MRVDRHTIASTRARRISLVLAVAIALIAATALPAFAKFGGGGSGKRFLVSAATYRAAGGHHGGGRAVYQYRVVRIDPCANHPVGCIPGQRDACPRLNKAPRDNWLLSKVWRRKVGAPWWGPPLDGLGGECLNYKVIDPTPIVTPEMVRQVVAKVLPAPGWQFQPPADALIIQPVIVAVGTPRDRTFGPFTLLGQPVVARAHVRAYHWDFGDGTGTDADWPGRPYTHGVDCTPHACDGYVNHAYTRTGTVRVTVTLRWTVTFKVGADPRWQAVPGDMTSTTPARPLRLVAAHAVLVTGS